MESWALKLIILWGSPKNIYNIFISDGGYGDILYFIAIPKLRIFINLFLNFVLNI